MRDEIKPKIMLWLCGAQFVLSTMVLGLNIPTRMFIRHHGGPDEHVEGKITQLRRIGDSYFSLHTWSLEMACTAGLLGILVFVALLITLCRTGWTRLVRQIRNPDFLTAQGPDEMHRTSWKMVFLHPRVIISAILLTNLFIFGVACIWVYLNYASSDHLDVDNAVNPKSLGAFDIETYLCETLQWLMRDEPSLATMLADERCMLAKGARWMLLLSTIFALFQFGFCLWAVDSISQPLRTPKPKAPKVKKQRANKRHRRDSMELSILDRSSRGRYTGSELVPDVERMVGKL